PLPVYSSEKIADYSQRFSESPHLNFKAEEDKADIFLSLITGLSSSDSSKQENFSMPGYLFSYKASTYPEFTKWVKDNPFIYMDENLKPLAQLGSLFNSTLPELWGAHMPEGYALTAPQAYKRALNAAHKERTEEKD